ncbi:TraB/GumN family protein [Candidatus Marithrix sp. Canyon 246]|uniref:TraB/GumN family protein n=1 Tax=Candidatus Marithrix sp. Canyon 246 TaxID=1827136 RepID=UPI000849F5A9|nr:TraB/GumN family protein [Candidatus Marithrix sp. Canyon 246]
MKPNRYIWLILFFLATPLSAESLLWQINKDSLKPSYIFGTMHSEDQRVLNLIPSISERFKTADNVAFEVLMDMPTMTKSANAMFILGNKTLDKIVDTELFAQIVKALQPYKIPSHMVKYFKPWAVMLILNMPPSKTGKFLDLQLYKQAQDLKLPTHGLETVDEQLAVFEVMSIKDQVFLLKESLKTSPDILEQMLKLYLQGDLNALLKLSHTDDAIMKDLYKRLIDDRNLKMLKRMEKLLQKGNAFIAIGALHLPGKKGVLQLLKQRAYIVKAIH